MVKSGGPGPKLNGGLLQMVSSSLGKGGLALYEIRALSGGLCQCWAYYAGSIHDTLPLPTAKRIRFNAKKRADFILKIYEIAKKNIEKGK